MNRRGVLLGAAAMVASWRAGAQEAPKSAHIGFIVTGGKGFPGHWFDEVNSTCIFQVERTALCRPSCVASPAAVLLPY